MAGTLVVAAVAVGVGCWLFGLRLGLDSSVYRAGAMAVLHGQSPYGRLAGASGLPFIYPPVAAILMVPLALMPPQVGWVLLTVLSVAGLGLVVRICFGTWPGQAGRIGAVLLVCVCVLEPVWRTLGLGQVNIVLMALVVLDVLALPGSKLRGMAIGLAAAIKLTPLVFIPYLAITGRRADAARALGAFAALNAVGALVMPGDTVRFWRSQMLGGVGVTTKFWFGNQSLNGLILRLSHEARWAFPAAIAAGLVCVAIALPLARRLHGRGDDLGGMLVMAFAGVLASPISWTHHWIWVVPLACLLARRARRPVLAVAGLAAVFTGWSLQLVPSGGTRELAWTPVQMVLGNAYVLAAIGAAVVLWYREISASAESRLPPAPARIRTRR